VELADAAVVGTGVLGAAIARALAEAGLRVAWIAAQGDTGADPARAGLIDPVLGLDFPDALRPLARRALAELRELELDAEGESSGLGEGGVFELLAADALPAARPRAAALARLGCELLERRALGPLAARLPSDVAGALFSPADAWIDPERLRARLAAAARRAGVRVVPHASALGLATAEGSTAGVLLDTGELIPAGDVVLAAEASAHLAPWPEQAPWRAQRAGGERSQGAPPFTWQQEVSRISVAPRPPLEHALVRGSACVLPGTRGELWLGAGEPEPADPAQTLLPELRALPVRRAWRSALARVEDGLPLLGRLPDEQGVSIALAFGRFAPVFAWRVGEWLTDLLVRGDLPADSAALDARRLVG
jgi:glycine/D-amino acid oxidase-like deaminating enzyme